MNIQYIGERLWAGQLGNIFIIIAFTTALLSSLSYFSATRFATASNPDASWKKIARFSYWIHAACVIGMVVLLFIMLAGHYFEYEYIWHHSSKNMPMQYIASCFWEGQEGSFMLWAFWDALIGIILIRFAKEWEAPVMTTISLVQAFLLSMLLGIYIFDYKLGSNPFTILLRQHPDFLNTPIFQSADYLSKIDGRGLNPLLQNYWMVIHPPTLFLGFASTVVPFAFAIAGLWLHKYNSWQRPALPWTFFGIMVLGTGILMGGAWAYEALSFGGFWAWDPVENSSLVPWLILVGAGHTMMINKNKGQSLFATHFLALFSFLLVLYSTFLTRSGVLGNTSVHAFTDMGMSGQLIVYLLSFVLLAIVLLVINFNKIPKAEQEENILSREFWMFIGALVLLISSFQISLTTSIPVINKVFGTNMAPPEAGRIAQHFHQWQIPFAILVLIMMATSQFLKYKNTEGKYVIKKILPPLVAALIITVITGVFLHWFSQGKTIFYLILLFACLYAIFANAYYIINILKGKFDRAGSPIAHIGFGMILLGALISTSESEVISVNQKGDVEVLGKDFSNRDNILLQQFDTLKMGDYYVTYTTKRKEGVSLYYDVQYLQKNKNNIYEHKFTLSPQVQLNPRMGNVAEPDTRHFLTKDIYTHVTYADLDTPDEHDNSTAEYKEPHNNTVAVGDTFFTTNSIIVLEGLDAHIDKEKYGIPKADIAVGARLKIFDIYNHIYETTPIYYIMENVPNTIETSVDELGIKFAFWQVHPETGKVDISVSEKKAGKKDFIVMKAVTFPFINILWGGCLIMIIGTIMAIRKRICS